MNLTLLADPEWLVQLALEDLAGRISRQGVDKIDRPRHPVGGGALG